MIFMRHYFTKRGAICYIVFVCVCVMFSGMYFGCDLRRRFIVITNVVEQVKN